MGNATYLGNHTVLAKTQYGHKIYVDGRDTTVAPHIIADGMWEGWVSGFFIKILAQRRDAPGARVLDVGANYGWYALIARWHPTPEQYEVWAYEPNPRVVPFLARTFSVNGMNLAHLREAAVSDETGFAQLIWYEHETANARLGDHVDRVIQDGIPYEERVPTVLLDDEHEPGSRIAAIKIDAEGYEFKVLRGAQRILDENPSIDLLYEHHPDEEHFALAQWLWDRGFSVFLVDHDARAQQLDMEALKKISVVEMLWARRMDVR